MVEAELIEKTIYGRYSYFKLANEDIVKLLELLMKLSKSPIRFEKKAVDMQLNII